MTFEDFLEKTFAAWEADFRANPANFLTAEEVAEMEIAPLAVQQRIAFLAYARQLNLRVVNATVVSGEAGEPAQ